MTKRDELIFREGDHVRAKIRGKYVAGRFMLYMRARNGRMMGFFRLHTTKEIQSAGAKSFEFEDRYIS